jgi:hypothetical protein
LGIFDPEEKFGAESGAGDGGGDYCPADWGGEQIAEAMAEC